MLKNRFIFLFVISLFITSCDLNSFLEDIKNKYEEFIGADDRGPKPFTEVFQDENAPKEAFVTSSCQYNNITNYVYYQTPSDAQARYYSDTSLFTSYPGSGDPLKPFWDIRYVNSVSKYINNTSATHYADHSVYTGLDARSGINNVEIGTNNAQTDPSGVVAQAECIGGQLSGGTILNLNDAPEQYLDYAGIQSTFKYHLGETRLTSPWKSDGSGNIMIQANFDRPIYKNFENNIGGGVYFGLFLYNKKNGKHLNYVIGLYASGDAWMEEKSGIRFDPTTGIVHVATVVKDSSWWSTKSPISMEITEVYNTPNTTVGDDGVWPDFFRVNISYNNLKAVLDELRKNPPPSVAGEDFGLNPEDWIITSIMIQYELDEKGGKAMLSGSFNGFNAYISSNPI